MLKFLRFLWKTWRDPDVSVEQPLDKTDEDGLKHKQIVNARADKYITEVEGAIEDSEPVEKYVLKGRLIAMRSGDFLIGGPEPEDQVSLFETLGRHAGHPAQVEIKKESGERAVHTVISPRTAGPLIQVDAAKPKVMDMMESLRFSLYDFIETSGENMPVEVIIRVFPPLPEDDFQDAGL